MAATNGIAPSNAGWFIVSLSTTLATNGITVGLGRNQHVFVADAQAIASDMPIKNCEHPK